MTRSTEMIDYAVNREHSLGKLALDESVGRATVTFAVAPTWSYVGMIVWDFCIGAAKLAMGMWMAWRFRSILNSLGTMPSGNDASDAWARRFPIEVLGAGILSAILWWAGAMYLLRMYRSYGRFPVSLTATDGKLSKLWLGWWRPRERTWGAKDIASIELRAVNGDLFRHWRTTATLFIHMRSGKRLRFRLTSRERDLPPRIALALGRVLGCEVKVLEVSGV